MVELCCKYYGVYSLKRRFDRDINVTSYAEVLPTPFYVSPHV